MCNRKKTFSIIILRLALIFFIAATTSFAQVPQVQHVVIVLEENTDYADVCGPNNTSMPFLCRLKSQGSFSADYYAPTHPSIGNYDDLGWGVVTTNADGCNPNSCGFPYTGDNIVREVQAVNKTWKGYSESLPSTCYFGGDSGQYAVRHSPIPYISDVQSNCLNRYVAFEDSNLGFAHDVASNTLPNFSFIAPNLCDDAHDCTLPGSLIPDQWLQNNVIQPLLLGGHLNPTTGDTILIVVFDESNADNTNGGGLIYWFMMGKGVKQNYQSTGPSVAPGFYAHESTLRLIAEVLGASFSGLGGAATAPDMTEFFGASGPAPVASVSPTSLTFASQTVGTTSAAQLVTLANTGNASLNLTSIAVTGTNSGDFAQTNNCGRSVAAGANCTISVTFTPTAPGTRSSSLSITDNASGSPQSVSLTGTGAAASAPVVSLSASSLAFASQTVGTTSAAQSVTLSNTGNASLNLTGVSASGDFAQTNTCGSSVAAGANCTISVTFTPTASGSRTGTLSITDNASGSPQSVSLTGTGAAASAPVVSLSTSSLAFASQTVGTTSAAQSVTLSNTGNASLNLTSVSASGDFAQTNTCGSSVAASANCTISVTFTPTASGSRTGTLSITDNASGSPQSVSLTGIGSTATRDFSLLASPTSGTITAGQSANFTLNLSPSGGFNQVVSLACSGAPQAGTCTISPNSVTLNGSSASTATLTVTTTVRGMLGPQTGPRWIFPGLPAMGERIELTKILWLMATLALLGLLAGRRRQVRLALEFAILMVVLGAGCAGAVKSTTTGSGTPAGTYTLTLTGASGVGSSALNHSINLTLTVN